MTQTASDTRTGGASARAIQAHYDISNEFFALWLDPTMTYSAALWEPGDSLEAAQLRKLDYHLDAAAVSDGESVVDIGCGWGSMLRRAVARTSLRRAVGLTLSREQYQWARRRCEHEPAIEIRLESWAEHRPVQAYDAVVSIGAFEHFARTGLGAAEKHETYRRFFRWCHENTNAGARLALQTIVYENYDEAQPNRFVEEIFPESELPRLNEVLAASRGLFELVRVRNDRAHYAETLKAWYANLRSKREQALALVGAETYAKYERYLGVFVVGFHVGTVNLARLAFRRIDQPVGRST